MAPTPETAHFRFDPVNGSYAEIAFPDPARNGRKMGNQHRRCIMKKVVSILFIAGVVAFFMTGVSIAKDCADGKA
ncbi:MAG: hypothetical protein DRH37_10975, partial [Deltaproteobacteria bacterium]